LRDWISNLSNPGQLGAKVAEFWVDSGQDVLVKHSLWFHGDRVDFDAWELDNLLHSNFLILQASGLKVKHQKIIVDLTRIGDSFGKTPVPLFVVFIGGLIPVI
jgi:hypothetical protein